MTANIRIFLFAYKIASSAQIKTAVTAVTALIPMLVHINIKKWPF